MKKRIAGIVAALTLATLTGCATVAETDGMVLPFIGVGVISFETEKAEPSAKRVNAQVARLLNEREHALQAEADQPLVAAR